MSSETALDRARTIKARYAAELMSKANVVAVGVGFRKQGEQVSDQVCVVVSVTKKVPRVQLASNDVIPGEIEGVPIDVQVTGDIRAFE